MNSKELRRSVKVWWKKLEPITRFVVGVLGAMSIALGVAWLMCLSRLP